MTELIKEQKLDWFTRLLVMISPRLALFRMVRLCGFSSGPALRAHDLFTKIEQVEVVPSASQGRGFMLILDRHTALYFNQDGDHFAYDGFEIGQYAPGDIRIFDGVNP